MYFATSSGWWKVRRSMCSEFRDVRELGMGPSAHQA